ncbi:MAG: hypothetical protein HOE90_22765 [Bacteriovoracaceae bacterium]|nr:hypothetical protein [Bacteriovoracaceae bacterium]
MLGLSGKESADTSEECFNDRLSDHIELVKESFKSHGLEGYLVLNTGSVEIAYQKWPSREIATKAFQALEAKLVIDDSASFMNTVLFRELGSDTSWLNSLAQ